MKIISNKSLKYARSILCLYRGKFYSIIMLSNGKINYYKDGREIYGKNASLKIYDKLYKKMIINK